MTAKDRATLVVITVTLPAVASVRMALGRLVWRTHKAHMAAIGLWIWMDERKYDLSLSEQERRELLEYALWEQGEEGEEEK